MGRLGQAKQLAQMLRTVNNPQAMVSQVISQNPQITAVVNKYGDPKTAFYKLAEQQGIDGDEILRLFR